MLLIDGSLGEGGGQIIRTSLALSLITGKPFRIERVRAGRAKPGLQRQHLTAVRAAAEIGRAEVEGAGVGAQQFSFRPGEVRPGDYRFPIGTAGATTLVLQTVLPPLMTADAPSTLWFEGGTHNVHAPPFDFLEKVFLPLVNRMGPRVALTLERYGFYPPGGGRFSVSITPAATLAPLHLDERGSILARRARALIVNLPPHIAERELATVAAELDWTEDELRLEASKNAISAGNVVMLEVESEHLTEMFTRVGERGLPAERVALEACEEARRYLATDAPVGEHLADQLLIPLALAGRGSYTTLPLSLHTTTNIEVIKKFLDVEIKTEALAGGLRRVEINS
ncbi:MAG TPA: RNA 3'-terminal phosphate cyclase [Pyrinomonadaceae bacterium]|nr:RNA 3'-terminal phosphate cyclase [Pyrinomonadaceae bacterium]